MRVIDASPETSTWTGMTSTDWAGPNWTGGNNPPVSGDSLVFGATNIQGNTTLTDTFTNSGFDVAGITFTAGAPTYTMTGNAFNLTGNITNNGVNFETIDNAISITGHDVTVTSINGNSMSFEGAITGSGGFIDDDLGMVLFSGTGNTYTGNTEVEQGTLRLQNGGGVTIFGNVTVDAGATLLAVSLGEFGATSVVTLNSANFVTFSSQTIAGLNGTGVFNSSSFGTALTLIGSGNYQYGGSIVSNVAPNPNFSTIVKNGTGSQEFDGVGDYAGGTILNSGTLIAGNSAAFGTGLIQVNGGELTVGNGNQGIQAGSYAQTAGSLAFSVAGTAQAATADQLRITNTSAIQVTLGGNLTVNLANFTAPPVARNTTQTYTFALVDADAGYTGMFGTFDPLNLGSGLSASLDYGTLPDDVLLQITQSSNSFSVSGLTPTQNGILNSINNAVAAGSSGAGFTTLLDDLAVLESNSQAFGSALDQLSPQAFGQFATGTAFNNASFQTQARDGYLAGQRGQDGNFVASNGGIDSSGLTVNDGTVDPNLSMVHSRLLAWNPSPMSGVVSDVVEPLLGGIDMKDDKAIRGEPGSSNPWNVFVQGNVVLAQASSNSDSGHFDNNTESGLVGADYRITPHFLVGLTAGYAHTDATLDAAGSSATVDSYSPGIYASYAEKGWYANFIGDYVYNSYTQARNIPFLGDTASSSAGGNEGVVNLDGGYDFHRGALTFGPLAGLQYTHLTVNGYSENGSAADLNVDQQQDDSLRSRLGGRVSYVFHDGGLSFIPHMDVSWQHEFMDQSRGITSQFNGFGGGSFDVSTSNPSRDSALVDAGVDTELNRTVTLFADYEVQAGQANYFGQSVQAGLKIGF
jgi:fibronectin-binding autotransporter adhesin